MKSNVCDGEELRLCTGCGVCVSVCGTKAITIKLDNEGYYKPVVDEDKCVECNLCKKSCYKYDENPVQSDKYEMCYAAVNKNEKQLKVDLPDPDCPTKAIVFPFGIVILTSLNTSLFSS